MADLVNSKRKVVMMIAFGLLMRMNAMFVKPSKPRRKCSNIGRPKEMEYNLLFSATDVDLFLMFVSEV